MHMEWVVRLANQTWAPYAVMGLVIVIVLLVKLIIDKVRKK